MKSFQQYFIVLLVLLVAVSSGCKNETIPEKDMVIILSQVFITDAVVNSSKHSFELSKRDTIEYYAPIYTAMGYTEEQFAVTMNYLFDNPKIFDSILDKVVNRLSVMEVELESNIAKDIVQPKEFIVDSTNLWDKKSTWFFPADGDQDSLYFKIPITKQGTYTLSAIVNVFPNDESIEPKTALWLTRDSTGIRDNVKVKRHARSKKATDVSLSLTVPDSSYTHLEGVVLGHITQHGDWKKFAKVYDIEITYSPLIDQLKNKTNTILLHDSLRVINRSFQKVEKR